MRKPAPSSLNSFIADKRLRATSLKRGFRRNKEVGVRALIGAADATPKLIKLGEARRSHG